MKLPEAEQLTACGVELLEAVLFRWLGRLDLGRDPDVARVEPREPVIDRAAERDDRQGAEGDLVGPDAAGALRRHGRGGLPLAQISTGAAMPALISALWTSWAPMSDGSPT